jgi:hypothetical protein
MGAHVEQFNNRTTKFRTILFGSDENFNLFSFYSLI